MADPIEERQEPAGSGLSDLEVALLGLLSVRPTTGYDIQRHYARALAPWWETPRTQIYPKLRELQRRGLVEDETVVQDGKPNKRLFSLSDAGSAALRTWLQGPIGWPDMRHQMMMRLFLGNLLPAETTRALLEDYRQRTEAWASSLREAHDRFSRSLEGPYRESVFFELLSLEHLIAIADLERSGAETALKALERAQGVLGTGNGEQSNRLLEIVRDLVESHASGR